MPEMKSGSEYLDFLKKKSGKERQIFDSFFSYLEKKARIQGVPLCGEFELTPLCNLDCKMCYVHLQPEQMQNAKLLSVEQWKNLISQAVKAGMVKATLTGGECLTYPGFREIFLHLHSLGCEVSVYTNGVLLDEDWIGFFKKHSPEYFQITLYGDSEDAYERVTGARVFKQVIDHIQMLKQADLPVKVTITPNRYLGDDVFGTVRLAHRLYPNLTINSNLFKPKENTGRASQYDDLDIETYIQIFRELGVLNGKPLKEIDETCVPDPLCCLDKTLQGSPAVTEDAEKAERGQKAEEQHEETKGHGLLCGGGRSSFTINWMGEMVPCSMMDMIRGYPLKDGFETAWKEINHAAEHWPRPQECDSCLYQGICNNCAAYMLQFAEPGILPKEVCKQTRRYVCAGVYPLPEIKYLSASGNQ